MNDAIAKIIQGLADADTSHDTRMQVRSLAESGQLGPEHALEFIRAAPGLGPASIVSDPSSSVLYAARDLLLGATSRETVDAVREVFPHLRPDPRSVALAVLTSIPTPYAAQTYVDLFCAYVAEINLTPTLEYRAGQTLMPGRPPPPTPEIGEVLFPALLAATSHEDARYTIYVMVLNFLTYELIASSRLASHEEAFVAQLHELLHAVREHQQANTPGNLGWKYEDPYANSRDLAGLMLDIASRWHPPAVLDALNAFADVNDPRLRAFRALALIKAGRTVPDGELEWIARSPRERFMLQYHLGETEHRHLLPESCRDQAKLAEGNMVDWLCFGTELDREPDEIELVHVETRLVGKRLFRRGTLTDYFFFRFRVTEQHWSKERGWTVGMAGGYPRTEGGTTDHDGGTFSHFTPWDSKPLAQHIAEYLD